MIGHSVLVFHNFNSITFFEGKALFNIWDYFIMVDSQGWNYCLEDIRFLKSLHTYLIHCCPERSHQLTLPAAIIGSFHQILTSVFIPDSLAFLLI